MTKDKDNSIKNKSAESNEEVIEDSNKDNSNESENVVEKVKKVLKEKKKTIQPRDFNLQIEDLPISRNTNTTLDKIAESESSPVVLSQVRNVSSNETSDDEKQIKYLGKDDESKYRESSRSSSSSGSQNMTPITPIRESDPSYIPNMGRERQNEFTKNEFDLGNFQRNQRGFNEPMIDYIAKPEKLEEHKPNRSGIARNEFKESEDFLEKYNI